MTNTLVYAKDLKEGSRLLYHGVEFTAQSISKFDAECTLCHGAVSGMIRVGVPDGHLRLYPREAVEVLSDGAPTSVPESTEKQEDIGERVLYR